MEQVVRLNEKMYKVSSFTNSKQFYVVRKENWGEWSCTCPFYEYQGKEKCDHIRKVQRIKMKRHGRLFEKMKKLKKNEKIMNREVIRYFKILERIVFVQKKLGTLKYDSLRYKSYCKEIKFLFGKKKITNIYINRLKKKGII